MLIRLILAHLLSDFFWQSKKVVQWKNQSFPGHFVHYLIHFAANLILFHDVLPKKIIIFGLLIITITHIVIDEIKINYLKSAPQKNQLGPFLIDQAIHFSILVLVNTWWANQGLNISVHSQIEQVLLYLSLGLFNTYFMSLLLYYMQKKQDTKITYHRDYLFMAFRIVITAITLIGGGLYGLAIFVVFTIMNQCLIQNQLHRKIILAGNILSFLGSAITVSVLIPILQNVKM